MGISEVVENLFDGIEHSAQDTADAKKALENLKRIKNWSYEQLDEWCWADSNRAFDYIFG